ncbi:MFS transporter [Priestia endophytica]|uniref:MFS transporter n=1 Tax=Priestia endophytica TaxID=135735 RepID=UPI000F543262|nr:MFS transporter [Priestia endophytica]RPK09389.1 hypothetical protein FH5_04252 [Priestia endophytica]
MHNSPAKSSGKYSVLAFLFLGWCISYIDRAAINIGIAAIGSEFNLSTTVLGVVLSSFFIGYAIMQLPGGWLADKFGSKKIIISAILIWSVFTIFTGLSWSLASLVVIRFLFGIGEGAYPSASLKGIAETFPKKERPRMASILMSSNYVGSAFAPLIIAPMILLLGWRETFFIIGAAGIIFVLFYWLFIKSPVQKEEKQSKKTVEKTSLKQLLKMPLMWQLVIAWFGLSMVNKGLDSWMPTYLMNVRNLDLKAIGILTPLPFVAAGIAMTIGGWMMDKYFSGKEKYLLISSASLTAIFLYLMYNASSVAMVITFQALVYFFKSFVFATVTALPQKMFSKDIIGSASGMINLGGQSAGFVSPLMIGILISAFNGSYDAAFWFLIASAGLSIISGLTIQRVRKSTEIDDAPTPTVS